MLAQSRPELADILAGSKADQLDSLRILKMRQKFVSGHIIDQAGFLNLQSGEASFRDRLSLFITR